MKKTLLLLILFVFISFSGKAQVAPGQIDDFQTGTTTLGWFEGGASPNPPVYVADGGPLGVGDAYISDDASGGGGPGSRQVVRNVNQWAGDYSGQSIDMIRFHARVTGPDHTFRIAMDGDGGRIASTNSVVVTQAMGWSIVEISILPGNMTTVGGFDVGMTLGSAQELRILSAVNPSFIGDAFVGTMDLDNIEAVETLSIEEFSSINDFKISPNPSALHLNIGLSQLTENTKVEVFDILGKRILFQNITDVNTRIDASQWSNGVYLVKISNDVATQTKRFVKQ